MTNKQLGSVPFLGQDASGLKPAACKREREGEREGERVGRRSPSGDLVGIHGRAWPLEVGAGALWSSEATKHGGAERAALSCSVYVDRSK